MLCLKKNVVQLTPTFSYLTLHILKYVFDNLDSELFGKDD